MDRQYCVIGTALFVLILAAFPTAAQLVNEIQVSTTGTDWEFFEVYGVPSTSLAGVTLIGLEGDAGTTATGTVDLVFALSGSTNGSGFYVAASPTAAATYSITPDESCPDNSFENGTATYLLVTGWAGAAGNDLDTDDDGALDSTPWTTALDSVCIRDSLTDLCYSPAALGPDGSFLPSGVFRDPDGGPWSETFLNFSTPDGTPGTAVPVELQNFVVD